MQQAQPFEQRWSQVRAALMKHADELVYNAGMAGEHHDGGAEALRQKIRTFEAGMARSIPVEWERIVAPLLDPEWSEYQRLRDKFERS